MRRFNIRNLISAFVDPRRKRELLTRDVSDHEILAAIWDITDEETIAAIKSVPTHFASTFSGNITARLQITEKLAPGDIVNLDSSDDSMKFTLGPNTNFTSGIAAISSMSKALTGGTDTIDLTNLTHRQVSGITFSGLKVKYFAWYNPSANPVTIVPGAANGNALHGAAFKLVLNQNDYYAGVLANSPSVAGGAKNIDVTGSAGQSLSLLLAAG
jgi:hypothetical protein